jgi:hypothetical protein
MGVELDIISILEFYEKLAFEFIWIAGIIV